MFGDHHLKLRFSLKQCSLNQHKGCPKKTRPLTQLNLVHKNILLSISPLINKMQFIPLNFFFTQNCAHIFNKWYVLLWRLSKSKLKKSVTQCPRLKSKNQIFGDEKIQKAYKNPKLASKTKFLEWFGHKTSEPIGFHDNIVIIQRKLLFPKKSQFQTDFKAGWYTLMYFWHSELILSSIWHNGTLAQHYQIIQSSMVVWLGLLG